MIFLINKNRFANNGANGLPTKTLFVCFKTFIYCQNLLLEKEKILNLSKRQVLVFFLEKFKSFIFLTMYPGFHNRALPRCIKSMNLT